MRLRSIGFLAAFLLVSAGCGDDDDKPEGMAASGKGGGGAGSSSVGAGGKSGSGASVAGSGGSAGSAGPSGPTESGVAGGTRLDALSDGDKQKLCAWGAALPGLGKEVKCPDGTTVKAEVDTGDECIQALSSASDCAATVSQYETCINAQLANPCEFFLPECDPIFACMQ